MQSVPYFVCKLKLLRTKFVVTKSACYYPIFTKDIINFLIRRTSPLSQTVLNVKIIFRVSIYPRQKFVAGGENRMPNKKSAIRRVRSSERNRIYNRFWTTRCKNAVKKVLEAVDQNKIDSVVKLFDDAQSVIDRAVVKGVMHKNTAGRRKAMMSRRVKKIMK
jgi:small subunit ribosomal protein S20